MTRVCGHIACGASLDGRRSTVRYCSPTCRTAAYRDRQAEPQVRLNFTAVAERLSRRHRTVTHNSRVLRAQNTVSGAQR